MVNQLGGLSHLDFWIYAGVPINELLRVDIRLNPFDAGSVSATPLEYSVLFLPFGFEVIGLFSSIARFASQFIILWKFNTKNVPSSGFSAFQAW